MTTTGQGLLGNNMFAYCGNDPVVRKDTCGKKWKYTIETADTQQGEEYEGRTTYTTTITYQATKIKKRNQVTNESYVVEFVYTVSGTGAIEFDNTQDNAKYLTNKTVRSALATQMYNVVKNAYPNALSNRTAKGISSELIWHYRFAFTSPGEKANIGGTDNQQVDYDRNGWIFERWFKRKKR